MASVRSASTQHSKCSDSSGLLASAAIASALTHAASSDSPADQRSSTWRKLACCARSSRPASVTPAPTCTTTRAGWAFSTARSAKSERASGGELSVRCHTERPDSRAG
eukprot:5338307-Prymnesium_polylepis.1